MNTFKKDNDRLMRDIVAPENVGGWMFTEAGSNVEELYAVFHSGKILKRVAKRFTSSFDGKGWVEVDSVPDKAEWIGQYKL